MIKSVSALLLSASVLAAAPASAADFLAFNITTTGVLNTIYNQPSNPVPISSTSNITTGFTAVAPASAIGQSTYGYGAVGFSDVRPFNISVESNGLRFTQTSSQAEIRDASGSFDLNIFVCGAFSGIPGAGSYSVDQSCSSVTYNYSPGRAGSASNPAATFTGKISDFTVSAALASDSFRPTIGGFLPGISPVPEPATWSMMLLGFAAVGTMLRHRPTSRLLRKQ